MGGKDQNNIIPLTDTLTELRNRLSVRLERFQEGNAEHLQALHRLNEDTAAEGQVSIGEETPLPDSEETALAWAREELGYFRFVMQKNLITGAVWSLQDTHTENANQALKKAGTDIILHSDPTRHREASSSIFDETEDADQTDSDATLLLLAEEFGLHGDKGIHLETIAVYMDGPDKNDRKMMKALGFSVSADGVEYEGSDPCTVFVATPESVTQALYDRAATMGITITPQASTTRK